MSRAFHILATLLLPLASLAATTGVNTGYFGNVAIKGYDPVAYFTEGKAVKGSEAYTHEWLGAVWHFASAEHRDLFAADPVRYAPQYGGHCATGIAYGQLTASIDPEAWNIIDGKLFLGYDPGGAEELRTMPGQIPLADAHWPEIKRQLLGSE